MGASNGFFPTLGIVIPSYNRRDNLYRCLGLLSWQTWQNFMVMVVDDGSTDGTREMIAELQRTPFWQSRLHYMSSGPKRNTFTGLARNVGAANLPPSVRWMMTLDTDLLINPLAFATLMDWHERYPESIVLGTVDWLPPLSPEIVEGMLQTNGVAGLRECVPNQVAQWVDNTLIGREVRTIEGFSPSDTPVAHAMRAGWYLAAPTSYPLDLYWAIGGYDEEMHGYGYQDSEFGGRSAHFGAQCLIPAEVWAVHVWHPSGSAARFESAQRNLDYIIRKFERMGVAPTHLEFFYQRIEWQYFWHYNRTRGGAVVKMGDEWWVVNQAHTHRLRLPHAGWLPALRFSERQAQPIAPEKFAALHDMGVAHDPLEDGMDYLPPPPKPPLKND